MSEIGGRTHARTHAHVRAHIPAVKTILSDAVFSTVFYERELSTINLTHDTRRAELIYRRLRIPCLIGEAAKREVPLFLARSFFSRFKRGTPRTSRRGRAKLISSATRMKTNESLAHTSSFFFVSYLLFSTTFLFRHHAEREVIKDKNSIRGMPGVRKRIEWASITGRNRAKYAVALKI